MRPTRPLVGALLALTVLAACATPADGPGAPASPPGPPATQPEPTSDDPAEPDTEPDTGPDTGPDAAPGRVVLVYYLTDTRAGFRLTREPRVLTGDPAVAAVEAMIAGPLDPDHATTWSPDTAVTSVTAAADGYVVDLSGPARTADVGSEGAAMMLQQLVWTVTEAMGDPGAAVTLTIDGEPAGELWGVLDASAPQPRADALDVLALVQIDSLAEGERVTSPVTVAGEAAVFEATVIWRVLDPAGNLVDEGFTTAAEGQTFSPYSFDVDLAAGTWTVVVEESDPSDGEGGPVMTADRTVVVE